MWLATGGAEIGKDGSRACRRRAKRNQVAALLTRVDCVVGMRGSIVDDAARSFAIGFYGGLGERESVAAAYKQGLAAIRLEGQPDADRPQLRTRHAVDAAKLVLASAQ